MVFSKEQTEQIKKQLLSQVDKMEADNKDEIRRYIESLNDEELENFLKQNKIQVASGEQSKPEKSSETECVFCAISKGEIPSYKLATTKKALAILEINPLSRGHSIIIPLKHLKIEEIPKSALTFSQKIAKKVKSKLRPEDIKIETSNFMGHSIINVIPIYKDIPLKKTKAEEKDLKFLQSKLETKQRAKRKKQENQTNKENQKPSQSAIITKESLSKLPKINFRIP